MLNRGRVFSKSSIQEIIQGGGSVVEGDTTIFVEDIAARDTLVDLEDEQRVIVLDAEGDDNAERGVAEYVWKDSEWVLLSSRGSDGKDGPQGPKGDPFVYDDFTIEQLEELRGPRGPKGDDGTNGIDGNHTMIIDYERQMDSVEADEGDKLYVKELESEFIWIDGEWVGLGGGDGGTADSILAEKVVTNNSLQFISRDQKKMIRDNQKEIEALKILLDTLEFDSEGKIKNNASDTLGYLEDKIGETLTFRKNALEVVKILGQIVSADDINQLDGVRANVQEQIDSLSRVGNFTGSVESKAELVVVQDAGVGDMVIVLEDESQGGESTTYMHNGATWEYVGKFNINVDLKAEDIKIKDTDGKFPVSKNVEAALAYLYGKFDTVEEAVKECCDRPSVELPNEELKEEVLQFKERRDLPEKGEVGTVYIVDEDETNNSSTSMYVWQVDPKTQRGNYTLLISATVGGKMQEYQQVTKLGVKAPRVFELPIPRTQNFLRAPIEVLEFEKGKNDVKVDTRYSNHSEDDFYENPYFSFSEKGFNLKDYFDYTQDDEGFIKVDLSDIESYKLKGIEMIWNDMELEFGQKLDKPLNGMKRKMIYDNYSELNLKPEYSKWLKYESHIFIPESYKGEYFIKFNFTGTRMALIGRHAPKRGEVEVYINGSLAGEYIQKSDGVIDPAVTFYYHNPHAIETSFELRGNKPNFYVGAIDLDNYGEIANFDVNSVKVKVFLSKGGVYYGIDESSNLVELGDDWELLSNDFSLDNKFNEVLELDNLKEYTIVSQGVLRVRVSYLPKPKLLLANGDLSLKAVDNIDYFKVDKTLVEQAEVKIIVSVDEGKNWNTYDSGVWEEIKPTVDQVDLYGIDSSVFDLISPKEWNELRKYSDTIRFGYLLKHNEEIDFAKVHALNAQFDMTGTWRASVHGKDYEYEYPDNSTIKVKILKSGDYKINY